MSEDLHDQNPDILTSLTGETIDKRTIEGDKPFVKCSNVLENKMQCIRPAQLTTHDDPDNKKALCGICYTLKNMPAGYNRQVGRITDVKHSS